MPVATEGEQKAGRSGAMRAAALATVSLPFVVAYLALLFSPLPLQAGDYYILGPFCGRMQAQEVIVTYGVFVSLLPTRPHGHWHIGAVQVYRYRQDDLRALGPMP